MESFIDFIKAEFLKVLVIPAKYHLCWSFKHQFRLYTSSRSEKNVTLGVALKIKTSHTVLLFTNFRSLFQIKIRALCFKSVFVSQGGCYLITSLIPTDPRFPSHHLFEQRSPPPPPPPPLLNSAHPVPTQNPMPFTQPGPAFNQQGQPPVFPRERPVRPNMQPQGPVGILHFNQPGSAAPRPFIPPRQQFLQAPGQPFLAPHTQPSMQVPNTEGVSEVAWCCLVGL